MHSSAIFKPSMPNDQSAAMRALARVGNIVNKKLSKAVDVAKLTREGVETHAIDALIEQGFSASELSWVVKPRTLSHRRKNRQRLNTEETGRWFRAAKIQALAAEVFADKDKSQRWLHKKRVMFDGFNAIEMMQTEAGSQLVEDTLNQIDAGYFA